MSNVYHILHRLPAFDRDQMRVDLEYLAEQLVKSGKLRIDAGTKQNYARMTLPQHHASICFSQRELTHPALLPATQQILGMLLKKEHRGAKLQQAIDRHIEQLLGNIRKAQPLDFVLEMRLARLLVQSAHPVVIALLIAEQVEVFMSYSYSIGDSLDIISWKSMGNNSGMQSTDGQNTAVFVSCGGDPFDVTEVGRIYGDGFPAIARMMVIAGQELGHYSDIKRDRHGRQISRYSANFSGTRATEHVRLGRLKDIKTVEKLRKLLTKLGMEGLIAIEHQIRFYKKQKINLIRRAFLRLRHRMLRQRFIARCHHAKIPCVDDFLFHPYPATHLALALTDMRDNLSPDADVYRRPDPREEEAIACIEALARIPQQVVKWGHPTTRTMMPSLYKVYYQEVIPGCIQAYKAITGEAFTISNRRHHRHPLAWFFSLKDLILQKKSVIPKKIAIYE